MQSLGNKTEYFDGRLLLRPDEAARALGLSRSRVYELISHQELPSIKIGQSRRIPVDALRAWVRAQSEGAAA